LQNYPSGSNNKIRREEIMRQIWPDEKHTELGRSEAENGTFGMYRTFFLAVGPMW
jgi:hypothetical protein